jgi:hypothetical protein
MLVPYLAYTEFCRSFSLKQHQAIKGARDFLWLSLLIALVIVVASVAVLANSALMDRFSAVLLGKIDGAGVPIRVGVHADQGVDGIDRAFLSCFDKGVTNKSPRVWLRRPTCQAPLEGLAVYPYWSVEDDQGAIRLPNEEVWKRNADGGTIRFDGWAVWDKDPIWRAALAQAGREQLVSDESAPLPLTLVVSRARFAEHFDYNAYRRSIGNRLPSKYVQNMPMEMRLPDDLTHLWLEVAVGRIRELVRFEIIWVDSIAASQSLVFLMPAPTLAVIEESRRNPEMRYFPEGQGKTIKRAGEQQNNRGTNVIGNIVLTGYRNGARDVEQLERELKPKFDCLQAQAVRRGMDLEVQAKTSMPMSWIADCGLEQASSGNPAFNTPAWKWIPSELSGDKISADEDGYLVVPCRRLTSNALQQSQNQGCRPTSSSGNAGGAAVGRIDMYSGLFAANVYATDKAGLQETRSRLSSITTVNGRQMMRIEPSYSAALARFDYIDRQVRFAGTPILFIGGLIILFALVNSLLLVVHNRRVNYGVMLANGMGYTRVYAVLCCQLLLSMIVATIAAALLLTVVVVMVDHLYQISGASAFGRAQLGVAEYGFMSFSQKDFTLAGGVLLSIALIIQVILAFVIYFMPLRPSTLPIHLQS